MDDKDIKIQALLDTLPPITLEQMESIKLMNRLDTKYVATKRQLIELLQLVQDKYYVQTIGTTTICPYRTTYFDTDEHTMYMMHHNKRARRTKVRVRTYLSSGDLTFLEVKKKNNHGRTKKKRICVKKTIRLNPGYIVSGHALAVFRTQRMLSSDVGCASSIAKHRRAPNVPRTKHPGLRLAGGHLTENESMRTVPSDSDV